ncbi:unnamed protein product [Lathyrus sativus]|nr:unnamed protein product [Lathyrus sativus]
MNSSEEGDDDHDQGKKRSYECTYCKRGFTNAQALGGHMNIHRKDRAKSNKKPQISNKFFTNDETTSVAFPFVSTNSSPMRQMQQYLPTTTNYLVENYQPSNVHGFGYDQYPRSSSSNWPNLHFNQELQGPNLSLQIGPTRQIIRRGNQEEKEVDLELRLGHDP